VPKLTPNHERHLMGTFLYLDQLLDDAERIMASSRSAFPRYVADLSPVQAKVLADHFGRFREALLGWVAAFEMAAGKREVSARHALGVQFTAAEIALEDLSPSSLRGYGAVPPEAVDTLVLALGDLRRMLRRMASVLEESADRDLGVRLERLAATADEARLLTELGRVITAHGLVELRPTLAMLVERMESRRFEAAVFGRVSSGKSSLLNYLLRRDVLPVGVTPITAVPTRVSFGGEQRVVVSFPEQPPEVVPLGRLGEFATERHNPGNRKHVTQISVELPEPRLESGVTFVDTPGLGSLATAGAEETLAYLPRCDLGLVLVDGASSPGPDDVGVIRALYQAGAGAAVLVSKADLLTAEQRQEVVRYLEDLVRSECGVDVRVSPVSVVGTSAALADEWFERELLPLCRAQEKAVSIALKRKVGALRDDVAAALRQALHRTAGAAPSPSGPEVASLVEILTRAAALPDAVRVACHTTAMALEDAAPPIIDAAAARAAASWRTTEDRAAVIHEVLVAELERSATAIANAVASRIIGLREELSKALHAAQGATLPHAGGAELPRVAGVPVLDTSALGGAVDVGRGVPALLGRNARRRWLTARLRAQTLGGLREVLRIHHRRLADWSRQSVDELERAFAAEAEAARAKLAPAGAPLVARAGALEAVERDLAALSAWDAGAGEEKRCRS